MPQATLSQPGPSTLQFTDMFVVPVTVAENCCFAPLTTLADVGDIVIPTVETRSTVTEADAAGPSCDVAVTVTEGRLGRTLGAVYSRRFQ
jgi:hypothetical protein